MATKNANEKTFTIAEVAESINVPARTIRKVLRASLEKDNQPGRGGRWVIRESQIATLTKMVNSHSAKTSAVADLSAFESAE